jgi:hypothetical protein
MQPPRGTINDSGTPAGGDVKSVNPETHDDLFPARMRYILGACLQSRRGFTAFALAAASIFPRVWDFLIPPQVANARTIKSDWEFNRMLREESNMEGGSVIEHRDIIVSILSVYAIFVVSTSFVVSYRPRRFRMRRDIADRISKGERNRTEIFHLRGTGYISY